MYLREEDNITPLVRRNGPGEHLLLLLFRNSQADLLFKIHNSFLRRVMIQPQTLVQTYFVQIDMA